MADKKEKNVSEKNTKKDKNAAQTKKKENIFKRMGKAIKSFFKNFKGECKKITWPTGKTVLNSSLVVIIVVAIVGVVIFAIDTGLSAILDALVGLANKQDTAALINLFFLR